MAAKTIKSRLRHGDANQGDNDYAETSGSDTITEPLLQKYDHNGTQVEVDILLSLDEQSNMVNFKYSIHDVPLSLHDSFLCLQDHDRSGLQDIHDNKKKETICWPHILSRLFSRCAWWIGIVVVLFYSWHHVFYIQL